MDMSLHLREKCHRHRNGQHYDHLISRWQWFVKINADVWIVSKSADWCLCAVHCDALSGAHIHCAEPSQDHSSSFYRGEGAMKLCLKDFESAWWHAIACILDMFTGMIVEYRGLWWLYWLCWPCHHDSLVGFVLHMAKSAMEGPSFHASGLRPCQKWTVPEKKKHTYNYKGYVFCIWWYLMFSLISTSCVG